MDREAVRRAWDEVSETYARNRDPTGPDADLLDDLLDRLGDDPLGSSAEFLFARRQ